MNHTAAVMPSEPPPFPTPRAALPPAAPAARACQVFAAGDIYVASGVNAGDALGPPEDTAPGDIYELDPAARPRRLLLDGAESLAIAPGSALGTPGERVAMRARYTLMSADGDRVELLVLALGEGLFALPLSPMGVATGYALLAVDTAPAAMRLSEMMSLSFARGTLITLASGCQMAIEALSPGDPVLTRDHGAQPVRLVGRATLRAVGAFAPVVIPAGHMGNSGDLIVSQHHRMFLYQRRRLPGMATAELLVQARHLVDGEAIHIREGGFVDWFSLVFDRHEIIYAEGIPAESLMVNDATTSRLPPETAAEVRARFPGLAQVQHFGTEAGRRFLDEIGPETLFASAPPRRPPHRPRG